MATYMKLLYTVSALGILFLASCDPGPSPWSPWEDSGDAAEAREAREGNPLFDPREATATAYARERYVKTALAAAEGTREAAEETKIATLGATNYAATIEAESTSEALATADAESARWLATREVLATREADATAAREAFIDGIIATDQAMLTEEAEAWATTEAGYVATDQAGWATHQAQQSATSAGCPGGCTTYPAWCEPPIKGNVSFNSGERIYHMPSDEFYDETKINPDYGEYYFCTSEEAEAAGFRRAIN